MKEQELRFVWNQETTEPVSKEYKKYQYTLRFSVNLWGYSLKCPHGYTDNCNATNQSNHSHSFPELRSTRDTFTIRNT